jgi:hypothetical protein
LREIIVSVILSKQSVYMYVSYPNGSRDRVISLYNFKIVDKKEISLLRTVFLILVFIAQVTKLVQFTQHNTFSETPPSTSIHFVARVRTWRVSRVYSVLHSEIAVCRKAFGIGHLYIYIFLLRMTDTVTYRNIDLYF